MSELNKYLDIPYLKLHFTAQVIEDCILPKTKASALRGGTGQMMIRQNCIMPNQQRKEEDCRNCDCYSECLVQRFLYTPMEIQPYFEVDKSSMGYLFECENYQEHFSTGQEFQFNVILFGKSRVYVNLLLQALWALGAQGLGKQRGRFVLKEITNSRKQHVMVDSEFGPQILKERLIAENLMEYVYFRKSQIARRKEYGELWTIRFQNETAMKYQGEVLDAFDMNAIVSNLVRRIYLFNCFMGREMDMAECLEKVSADMPQIIRQDVRRFFGRRYSTRMQSSMPLEGISGSVVIEEPDEDLLDFLLAGEIMHIGKNTSFGFGRYFIL